MIVEGRIREYLDKKFIIQARVADAAQVESSKFSRAMTGKGDLDLDELERICNVLEVDPREFIKVEKKPE